MYYRNHDSPVTNLIQNNVSVAYLFLWPILKTFKTFYIQKLFTYLSISRVSTSPERLHMLFFQSALQFPNCVYTTLGNWSAILWEKGITFPYVLQSCFHVKKTVFKCYFTPVHPLLGVASHSLFHCALMSLCCSRK